MPDFAFGAEELIDDVEVEAFVEEKKEEMVVDMIEDEMTVISDIELEDVNIDEIEDMDIDLDSMVINFDELDDGITLDI